MPLKQNDKNNEIYEIYEDKKAIKFLDKHSNNEDLQNRIFDKYLELSLNPYKEAENFKSKKCPKCKKTRVGEYRIIYFINKPKKEVEIIDIGSRKNIYKKWD